MLRPFKVGYYLFMIVLMVAGLAVPAFAQEDGGGPVHINYFSKLFHTESGLGNVVIWTLVINSTGLLALIIQAALQNRKNVYTPPELVEQLELLFSERKYKDAIDLVAQDTSPFGQIIAWTLKQASRGYDAMEEAMFEMADSIGNDRVRGLVWMEIAGAAGPMLGLFGTVYGMIVAFTQMVAVGGQPKPAELAGGIATALVCTFWGLVVGIPGVISAAVFRVKVERMSSFAIRESQRLLDAFRPGASRPTAGAKPTTPTGGRMAAVAAPHSTPPVPKA